MRSAIIVVLCGAASVAHAESYDECLILRRNIYAQAMVETDLTDRVTILRTMPECHARPSEGPPVLGDLVAPVLAVDPKPAVAAEGNPAVVSVTASPIAPLAGLLLSGVLLIGSAEMQFRPGLGVVLVGGVGRFHPLFSTSTSHVELAGAEVVHYLHASFVGAHIGVALLYRHWMQTAGFVDLIGRTLEAASESRSAFVGPVVGTKIVTRSGLTFFLQIWVGGGIQRDETGTHLTVSVMPMLNIGGTGSL